MTEAGNFRELNIPKVIDTSSIDFIDEFYEPLLSRASLYRRGVGYFTTNWVKSAARGIAGFAKNEGKVQWLVSPKLYESDWRAFKKGSEAKQNSVLKEALSTTIDNLKYDLEYETRNAVAWMIADGILEIKLAIPTEKLSGDFHDKFGVVYDDEGNRVSFHGSQNDSEQALNNYEAYTVACDWLSEREKQAVDFQEERFERLWEDQDKNVSTYLIPEASKEEIVELRDEDNRPYQLNVSPISNKSKITLREYQNDAVESWVANKYRGMFQMATGTGKTFTALAALDQFKEEMNGPILCVIAVPQKHLSRQWATEMGKFGLDTPFFIYGSANRQWKKDLSRIVSNIQLGIDEFVSIITTHTTLADEYFREKIQGLSNEVILIADEVHGLGSEYQRKGLLEEYSARIGLSATPERYYDEGGTSYLLNYFGGITYEYSLEDAIPEYLVPYRYYPIIVEMDQDELEEYRAMTKKVAAAYSSDDTDEEVQQILQSKRASITKSAIRKYDALRNILESLESPDHLLVYTNPDQIQTVGSILNEYGIIHHKFTYKEDDDLREELLDRFGKGEWDALVAMKCLDEGVDVPATQTAILMSNSGNPMQFIQRRGRVLRKAKGKSEATIFDMFVVPSLKYDSEIPELEKNIVRKELRRFEEFASTAKNEHEARNRLEEVRTEYLI